MANTGWYYIDENHQQVGPVDTAVLRQRVAAGRLRVTDLVWCEGLTEWVKAGEAAEIFGSATETLELGATGVRPKEPMGGEGYIRRLLAFIIDLPIVVVITFVSYVFLTLAAFVAGGDVLMILAVVLSLAVLPGLYFGLLEGLFRASIGKLVFGLRVAKLNGDRIGLFRGLLRYPLMFISIVAMPGMLLTGRIAVIGPRGHRQLPHDYFTGTVVFKARDPASQSALGAGVALWRIASAADAAWALRLIAFVIDLPIVLVIMAGAAFAVVIPSMAMGISIASGPGPVHDTVIIGIVFLWFIILPGLYFGVMERSRGGSVGKLLLRLRVTDMYGDRIDILCGLRRFIIVIACIVLVPVMLMRGHIVIAHGGWKGLPQDHFTKTKVVRIR